MIRIINGQAVWVSVISAGRAGEVNALTEKIGLATWYVPPTQYDAYRRFLDPDQIRTGTADPRGVAHVRNRMMEDAFRRNAPCLQFDDDLVRVMRLPAPNTKGFWSDKPDVVRATLEEFIATVLRSPFYLGGVPPTNNHFFANGKVRDRVFVRSHLWMIKPNPLRLDENMPTKFDYDYTLQQIREYGGICRCDNMIWDFDFGNKQGGHVDTRTKDGEVQMVEYLQRKWGTKLVRKHPRRHGEVLLQFPRRVVMT